jgi:hypothetical protein
VNTVSSLVESSMFHVVKFGILVIGVLREAIRVGGAALCPTVSSLGDPRKRHRVDSRSKRLRLKDRGARKGSMSPGREARWFVAGLLLAELVAGTPALAQSSGATPMKMQSIPVPGGNDAPADRDEEARQLYAQGIQARKAKQWEKAREAFLEALKLKSHPQIIANLGHAELLSGRYRDAAEHLSLALRQGQIFSEQDRREIEKMLEAAKAQIGTVTIQVNVDGARVVVDALEVGISPLAAPVPIEPGSRTFKVMKNGFMGASQVVEVAAGSAPVVELKLTPSPTLSDHGSGLPMPVDGTMPDGSTAPEKRSIVPAIVAGGLAVGAAAVGVGFFVASNAKLEDALALDKVIVDQDHQRCVGPRPIDKQCSELDSITRSGDTFHNIAVGAFVGAGIVVAGGLTYLLWPAPKVKKSGVHVHAAPVVGTSQGGLIIKGAF